MISGWGGRYSGILKRFGYSRKGDEDSAMLLDSVLGGPDAGRKIRGLVSGRTVFVIGSGPSLSAGIRRLGRYDGVTKIAADSSVKALAGSGIVPDIVVTDLDGDAEALGGIAEKAVFVVHAHGDNMEKLAAAKKFKNCIGTTQAVPFGRIRNFGGFTDGDRCVFLASHYNAKRIVLFGMDFGCRIGRFSDTKRADRRTKLMKLETGRELLEWLSGITGSELFTTSRPIRGFKKIPYKDLDTIAVENVPHDAASG